MAEANAPKLQVLFGADLTDFEDGIKRILSAVDKLERGVNGAASKVGKIGDASSSSAQGVGRLVNALDTNTQALNSNDAALDRVQSELNQTGVAADKFGNTVSSTSSDVSKLTGTLDANTQSLENNKKGAKNDASALGDLSKQAEKASASVEKSSKSLDKTNTTASKVESTLGKLTSSLKAMAIGYVSVEAAMRSGKAFVENAIRVERFEKMLRTATGSQKNYTEGMNFLSKVADRYKLNILELGKNYAQLTSAVRGTALEGAKMHELFEATAASATALQMSTDDVNGTFRAFIQMVSKGNVQAEELRGQLGERLVGAFNMAAQSMGVTTKELNKMLEQGQVLAADLLPKMAEEMRKTFGKEAAQGATSLGNQTEYAKGQLALMFAEFAKTSGVVSGLSEIAEGIGNIAKAAKETITGPAGNFFRILGALGGFAFDIQTGFAFSNPKRGADLFAGYSESLNPYQAEQARQKKRAFEASNADYAKMADSAAASERLRAEIRRKEQERARIAFEESNKAYAALAPKSAQELEQLRIEAERKASEAMRGEYKKWYEEYNRQLEQLRYDAMDKRIAEWEDKKARPTFGVAAPVFTMSGLKEVNVSDDIKNWVQNISNQIKNFDMDAQIEMVIQTDIRIEENDAEIQLQNKLESLNSHLEAILRDFSADAFAAMGEIIGNMFAGLNADQPTKKIGEVIGGLLQTLGKALIAYGVTTEEVKVVLETMNGWAAIAAGIVAIAAGTALKATAQNASRNAAQNFWTGGVVQGPGGVDNVPAWLTPGEMVLNRHQQGWLFRALNGAYGVDGAGSMGLKPEEITVNVVGLLSGNDLTIATERTVRSRKVHRGSLG